MAEASSSSVGSVSGSICRSEAVGVGQSSKHEACGGQVAHEAWEWPFSKSFGAF